MNQHKLIDLLYCGILDVDMEEHIIETDEMRAHYIQFCETLMAEKDLDLQKSDDLTLDLAELIYEYVEAAYHAGVQTAFTLVTGKDNADYGESGVAIHA